MKTETNLTAALKRSVSYNEIVRCEVVSLTSGLRALSEIADVDDSVELDDLHSEYRYVDVWGKTNEGGDFRLHLFATGPV